MTLQVDIAQLRKVSAVKGLVNNEVHAQLTSAGWMPSCSPSIVFYVTGALAVHMSLCGGM